MQKEIQDYYEFLITKYKIKNKERKTTEKRPYALAKDEFIVPDSFNEPLPDEITNGFYKQ